MSDILSTLRETAFMDFVRMFRAEEGRMGVTVTFIAILELMKEGLIEIVQAEPYAPIHVRPSAGNRNLTVVSNDVEARDADAENAAALAQPAHPDENDLDDDLDEALQEPAADEAGAIDASASNAEATTNTDDSQPRHADVEQGTDGDHDQSVSDDSVTVVREDADNTGQGQ